MEKGQLVPAWDIAFGPCSGLFELGAAIEPIFGFTTPLPLCDILTDSLLEVDVLACLSEPVGQACPLPDQGLVADLYCAGTGYLVGGEQASDNEGISDFVEDGRLLRIGQREFRECRSTACSILLGDAWIDQAQEECMRQAAMLFGRQRCIGGLGLLCQRTFDPANLLVGLQGQEIATAPLEELIKRELQER